MVLLFDLRDDLDVDRDEFLAFLDDACGLRGQVVGDLSVYDCVGRVDVQFKTFVAELLREFAGVDQVAHVDVDFEVVADDVRELIPVLDKDAGFFFELALHCLQGKLVGLDFAADAVKQSGLPLRMVLFHENDVLLYEKQSYDVFFHVNTPWSRLCSG